MNRIIYESDQIKEQIQIIMISDLHDHEFGINNQELINRIGDRSPDLILLNGDLINEDTQSIDSVVNMIIALRKEAPVYLSVGNKELENPQWSRFLKQLEAVKIKVLDAEYIDLVINNQKVRLGGLYDYSFALNEKNTVDEAKMKPNTVKFLKDFEDTDLLKIIMTHRPDTFLFNQSPGYWDIDLALAGHTHGGQVVIPFIGGLWAPDLGWFPEYVIGEKRLGDLTLITSSGLSTGHEKLPRFNNPPEIMEIVIKPVER